jgi:hypothetical protein
MSAFGGKADIKLVPRIRVIGGNSTSVLVPHFGLNSDIARGRRSANNRLAASFDHLVGQHEQIGFGDAERDPSTKCGSIVTCKFGKRTRRPVQ